MLDGERVPVLEPRVADPLERHAEPRRDPLERVDRPEAALREPVENDGPGRFRKPRGRARRENLLDEKILRALLDRHGRPSVFRGSVRGRSAAARFDDGEGARHAKST